MRKCAYCKQPLGFGEVTRLNRRNYAHFSCFEEEDKKDEAAMFAVNLTYPSTPLDLWIERELLEEEAEKNGDKKGKVIPFRRAS